MPDNADCGMAVDHLLCTWRLQSPMSKKILIFLLIGSLGVAQAQQDDIPSKTVRVTKGTILELAIVNPMDSKTAKPGEDVALRLTHPLIVDGITLLHEGQILHGKITKVRPVGHHCLRSKIAWRLDRVTFSDGSTAKLSPAHEGEYEHKHKLKKGEVAAILILIPLEVFIVATFAPIVLTYAAIHCGLNHDPCPGTAIPANKQVLLKLRRAHDVRYQPSKNESQRYEAVAPSSGEGAPPAPMISNSDSEHRGRWQRLLHVE